MNHCLTNKDKDRKPGFLHFKTSVQVNQPRTDKKGIKYRFSYKMALKYSHLNFVPRKYLIPSQHSGGPLGKVPPSKTNQAWCFTAL